jgi:hypothetical protein
MAVGLTMLLSKGSLSVKIGSLPKSGDLLFYLAF